MELTITINLDNDNFVDTPGLPVAGILRHYANRIANESHINCLDDILQDVSGNIVGTAKVYLIPIKR